MAQNLYAVEALANFMLVPREKPHDAQSQLRMLPNLLAQRLPDMLCTHNENMAQVVATPPHHAEQFTEDEARENEAHAAEAPEIDEHNTRELRFLEKIGGDHQHQGGECRGFQDITHFAEMAADTAGAVQPHAFENSTPDGEDKYAQEEVGAQRGDVMIHWQWPALETQAIRAQPGCGNHTEIEEK